MMTEELVAKCIWLKTVRFFGFDWPGTGTRPDWTKYKASLDNGHGTSPDWTMDMSSVQTK